MITFREFLQEAKQEEFDTSTIWYHATRAKKRIRNFKVSDHGINEMGKGIYFHKNKWRISWWAKPSGYYVKCYFRKGKMFNLSDRRLPDLYKTLLIEYIENNPSLGWNNDADGKDHIRYLINHDLNGLLEKCGYIGIVDDKHITQIEGQAVIFNRDDIKIIGYEDYNEELNGYFARG